MYGKPLSRRRFLAGSAAASALITPFGVRSLAAQSSEAGPITVTDVAGREVMLDQPAEKIVVTSRTGFYTLAVLDTDNPFQRIVAWNDDLRTTDKDSYNQYLAKFPEAADIPVTGNVGANDFNAEIILDLEPDLVVIDLGGYNGAREAGTVDLLESAGIQLVVVDFREHMLENTMPSVLALGRLLGRVDVALEYGDFYLAETNKVYDRIGTLAPDAARPSAFIQRAPGVADVGLTFGNGNFGEFIQRAGGINWAGQFVGTVHGTVNPEQILVGDFDVLIMTGANWSDNGAVEAGHFISMGYESQLDSIHAEIEQVLVDNSWTDLPAVEANAVYALWHQFYISPYAFIALQQFAKWLHPDLFEDVDPSTNFQALHERFLPIEYKGFFFADRAEQS